MLFLTISRDSAWSIIQLLDTVTASYNLLFSGSPHSNDRSCEHTLFAYKHMLKTKATSVIISINFFLTLTLSSHYLMQRCRQNSMKYIIVVHGWTHNNITWMNVTYYYMHFLAVKKISKATTNSQCLPTRGDGKILKAASCHIRKT